jgi:hypothetical protein
VKNVDTFLGVPGNAQKLSSLPVLPLPVLPVRRSPL